MTTNPHPQFLEDECQVPNQIWQAWEDGYNAALLDAVERLVLVPAEYEVKVAEIRLLDSVRKGG